MSIRLGDLLINRGALSPEQRDAILERQRETPRPFGLLAEQMFGVNPRTVEQAWAEQFASLAETVDLARESSTPEALESIERRQAWQFGMVPLRFEGEELVVATTQGHLGRAMRFAGWRIEPLCRFVLCDAEDLHGALTERYPMAGLDAEFLGILVS
jgi:hypothetical protein